MRYAACVGIVLICSSLAAQAVGIKPEFEVASVKPSAKDETRGQLSAKAREFARGGRLPGAIPMAAPDRVRLQNWALLDLIAAAYSVRATQILGPAWLSNQVFDIEAKVPDGTRKQELNAMLQSLLEERFGVKAHRETSTERGFALVVAKDGPRLEPAQPPTPPPDPGLSEEERIGQLETKMRAELEASRKRTREDFANGKLAPRSFNSEHWRSITVQELAAQLVRFTGAPVIDQTGLTGNYSVTIRTSTDAGLGGDTIFDAVGKLGLKLEPHIVTVDTVVVDQVSRTPTAN